MLTLVSALMVNGDYYGRQELLSLLVSHVANGRGECTTALKLMLTLITPEYVRITGAYVNLLKMMLDSVEHMQLHQVAMMYHVLVAVAYADGVSSLANELSILVRKQLSHSELVYKRIGVVGAVAILPHLQDIKQSVMLM